MSIYIRTRSCWDLWTSSRSALLIEPMDVRSRGLQMLLLAGMLSSEHRCPAWSEHGDVASTPSAERRGRSRCSSLLWESLFWRESLWWPQGWLAEHVLFPRCHTIPKGLMWSLVQECSISVTCALGSCCWKMVFSESSQLRRDVEKVERKVIYKTPRMVKGLGNVLQWKHAVCASWVGRQPPHRALEELARQLAGPGQHFVAKYDIGAVACDWRIMTLILT